VRSLSASLQKGEAANNIRVINIAPGFVKTSIHVDMGISFETYCERLGNPDFISADDNSPTSFSFAGSSRSASAYATSS